LCSNSNKVELFSTTGLVEPSAILYYDQYGQRLVTGHRYVIDNGSGCNIYQLNPLTGVVGVYVGNCSSYGGCV
jgi:hypothetical protein